MGLLLLAVIIGRRPTEGPPLDPDSVGPLGAKALVELLELQNVEVSEGLPDDLTDDATVFVLRDGLGAEENDRLLAWVDDGGTVVVADLGSTLGLPAVEVTATSTRGVCSMAGLDDVETLGGDTFAVFEVPSDSRSCFGDGASAFLVAERYGEGRIISVGGAGVFTNAMLDEADNAVLAVRLVASGRVHIIHSDAAPSGQQTLADLIPSWVWWASVQLLIAFGLFVWSRARRFGRVVVEPDLIELPAASSLRGAAELRRRTKAHASAAATLRAATERRLRLDLSLSAETATDRLEQDVLGMAAGESGLTGPLPTDAESLIRLVARLDQTLARVQHPSALADSVPEEALR